MYALNNRRMAQLLGALFSGADPSHRAQLAKEYQSVLFPEQKQDELKKLISNRKVLEKLRDYSFMMKPQSPHGFRA
jgi:hypothetical protein